jgi:hypothetical protein
MDDELTPRLVAVASAFALEALRRHIDAGGTVEIPSLGVTIGAPPPVDPLLRRLLVGRKALHGLLWHEVCATCTAWEPFADDPDRYGFCAVRLEYTKSEDACTSYEESTDDR